MTQLPLPLPEPGTAWERLGRWMLGECDEPRELVTQRAVRVVAGQHRALVNAAAGRTT